MIIRGNRILSKLDNPKAASPAIRAAAAKAVFPAKAGIHRRILDTGFRRCDGGPPRIKLRLPWIIDDKCFNPRIQEFWVIIRGNRILSKLDNPKAASPAIRAAAAKAVFPAKAGIHRRILDTGFRRCDGGPPRIKLRLPWVIINNFPGSDRETRRINAVATRQWLSLTNLRSCQKPLTWVVLTGLKEGNIIPE